MRIGHTIYLDHQSTTPVDARVLSMMSPYFAESFGNPYSVDHSIGWQAAQTVDEAANHVARLIGADSDEIVFTSGATEANNLALLGLCRLKTLGKRRRILVSAIEHKCVFEISRILYKQFGHKIEFLPVDASGFVEITQLNDALADDVLAVSIMAVNNEIGTIQDIPKLSEIVRRSGAFFHCDAAQAPCAIDLRHYSQYVDLLSLSGHKMYGPQGIGALFIRRDIQDLIEPIIYGGGQQRNLRSGTVPVPLCVGMGAAAALFKSDEADEERASLRQLTEEFVRKLMKLPWPITLNGPESEWRHPGNANIRFSNFNAQDILGTLQPHLAASTGSACTSGIPEPSHVLRAIGLSSEKAESSIRFSLGRNTSNADLEEAVKLVGQSLSTLAERDETPPQPGVRQSISSLASF